MRLQAILDHDAVTAPRQERSQRTLERILTALGELLSEKSLDQISMAELAGCAMTSIYARFKDKWSMIAALHESFREDAVARIDSYLALERWHGATADQIISATTAALVAAYSEHRHLLHAELLTDDPRVYSRAASVEHHIAERLAQVLPVPAGAAADLFRRRVQFAVRVMIATLKQRVLLYAPPGKRAARIDAELAKDLGTLTTCYLGYSRRRRGRPNGRAKRERKKTSR